MYKVNFGYAWKKAFYATSDRKVFESLLAARRHSKKLVDAYIYYVEMYRNGVIARKEVVV